MEKPLLQNIFYPLAFKNMSSEGPRMTCLNIDPWTPQCFTCSPQTPLLCPPSALPHLLKTPQLECPTVRSCPLAIPQAQGWAQPWASPSSGLRFEAEPMQILETDPWVGNSGVPHTREWCRRWGVSFECPSSLGPVTHDPVGRRCTKAGRQVPFKDGA